MFVRDDQGLVYLTHSGKVGGGRKGIGKAAFLEAYRGENITSIKLPDGEAVDAIIVGRVDGGHLPAHIAHFVREVERFKRKRIGTEPPTPTSPPSTIFSPEFSGARKSYEIVGKIESRCDHGPVISALEETLTARGFTPGNDRHRDLFLSRTDGTMAYLFEAKTDLSTTSLYTGVGQLMLHGAIQQPEPKRILVLPDKPHTLTMAALKRLGIQVVTYQWHNGKPLFHSLVEVLEEHPRASIHA
jgi:hypothetical protein